MLKLLTQTHDIRRGKFLVFQSTNDQNRAVLVPEITTDAVISPSLLALVSNVEDCQNYKGPAGINPALKFQEMLS